MQTEVTRPSDLAFQEAASLKTKVGDQSRNNSEMHHLVNKDDYLLARGANPRTGVITPGSHSASSSIDQNDAGREHSSAVPGRWRQKGDQWVSLDLGEPSPSATPPVDDLLEYPYQDQASSQTFAHNTGEMRGPAGQSHAAYAHPAQGSDARYYNTTATFHLRPLADGIGMVPAFTETSAGHHEPPPVRGPGPKPRRKPVGGGPGDRPINKDSHSRIDTSGSTETVVRRLHFSNDLRSSSAPDPSRVRNFTPADVGKDLPSLPQERPSSEHLGESVESQFSSFLVQPTINVGSHIMDSKNSSTFGHRLVEKDLPCLPTNNGQSQLRQETKQSQSNPQGAVNMHTMTQSMPEQQKPKGPRGGDREYPFVRTSRPTHHQPQHQIQSQYSPAGEREMPVPIYDNPPGRAAPLVATVGLGASGPRAIPIGNSTLPMAAQRRDMFVQSLNTTTIRTDATDRRPIPAPLHSGTPRPNLRFPGHRMMNHERFGSLPTHPLIRPPYDMSMNTGMSTDSMMSIPVQRIRPRAMPRPQVLYPTERALERTDSQMWTAAYQGEARLVPPPLKPRLVTNHADAISRASASMKLKEISPGGLGLTRKCSRCQHGLVDVKPHSTDGVTHTYEPGNQSTSEEKRARPAHPTGRTLLSVPEGKCNTGEVKQSPISDATSDERDHSLCCPECCKDQDCHEGCLGHASPYSTPNTSPTKSIWSEVDCQSSASEIEDSEDENDKDSLTSEKYRAGRLAFVKSAFKRSPKKPQYKFGDPEPDRQDTNSSVTSTPVELSPLIGSSTVSPSVRSGGSGTEGLNAAMSAAGSSRRKISNHTLQRRQRSSSSPIIGVGHFSRKTSVSSSQRSGSGSRLRVPTPRGLAIACSGITKTRNVSGNSISTLELQVPGLGSLGFGAVREMVIVPFEATKMWIRNHPQVLKRAWEILERGWEMSQVIATTAWRLWALIFVYSKTGKLKLDVAKTETAGGFVFDCARSGVYLLIFVAVGVFAIRVLNMLMGGLGLIGWLFKGFFWVLKQFLGFGMVR